jgi:hypothetical protein
VVKFGHRLPPKTPGKPGLPRLSGRVGGRNESREPCFGCCNSKDPLYTDPQYCLHKAKVYCNVYLALLRGFGQRMSISSRSSARSSKKAVRTPYNSYLCSLLYCMYDIHSVTVQYYIQRILCRRDCTVLLRAHVANLVSIKST